MWGRSRCLLRDAAPHHPAWQPFHTPSIHWRRWACMRAVSAWSLPPANPTVSDCAVRRLVCWGPIHCQGRDTGKEERGSSAGGQGPIRCVKIGVSRTAFDGKPKSAADLEPEGGFEPPTCRLRGRSRPTTTSKADRVEQLRKADCQAGNDCIKGGTLAETLAEQSRLSRTSCPFRLSDPHAPDRASARGTSAGWCIAVLRMIWVEGKARRRPSSVMASTYAGGAAGAGLRVGVRGR
jgi:hypothetical protein